MALPRKILAKTCGRPMSPYKEPISATKEPRIRYKGDLRDERQVRVVAGW